MIPNSLAWSASLHPADLIDRFIIGGKDELKSNVKFIFSVNRKVVRNELTSIIMIFY
jgi:hypothetical protein